MPSSSLTLGHALRAGRRWLYIVHRWVGVVSCLLFAMWFASGVVMMYVPYPALKPAARLAHLPTIDWSKVKIGPSAALAASGVKAYPKDVRLEMLAGEPVYRIVDERRHVAVSAIDGRRIAPVDERAALIAAKAFEPDMRPSLDRLLERDQWTVAQGYNWARPLYRIDGGDRAGTLIYVASTTGEVVLSTTRNERFWNWLGSVPHWIYPTALRTYPQAWRQTILWTSGAGIVSAITGIWVGLLRLRLRKRYSEGRMSPYTGWMAWHHWAGIVGGLFLTTWIVSGWLSVNPNRWFDRAPADKAAAARYAGAPGPVFEVSPHRLAGAAPATRQVQFYWLHGRPLAALAAPGRPPVLFDAASDKVTGLDDAALFDGARTLMPEAPLRLKARLIDEDAYWYTHHDTRQLPILRVGFDDPGHTWFYIAPDTGQVLSSTNDSGRAYRWIFYALHDFDLRMLLKHRPAWDILVWALSIVGMATSVSGVVIGWRRLVKKAGGRSRRATARTPRIRSGISPQSAASAVPPPG